MLPRKSSSNWGVEVRGKQTERGELEAWRWDNVNGERAKLEKIGQWKNWSRFKRILRKECTFQ